MRYDLEQRRISHWIDLSTILMNWVALCGYWCIIMPHFIPSPRVYRWLPFWVGHEKMLTYGNLVGDIFWTLEPLVCLYAPKLLLRPRGQRKSSTVR